MKILNSRVISAIIIVAVLVFAGKFIYDKYTNLQVELAISQQNESALKDSLRISKNEVGDLVASKQVLVAQHKSDLKKLNKELFDEAKKYKGKIHELTKIIASIKATPTVIDNTTLVTLPNGDSGIGFEYAKIYDGENSRFIEGISLFEYDSINNIIIPLETRITRDEINFNLTQGLRTANDGKIEMFASSSYPGFEVQELNSVIIDPSTHPVLKKFTKKKKFGIGIYGGYGATLNLSTSRVIAGPQIGIGFNYILW